MSRNRIVGPKPFAQMLPFWHHEQRRRLVLQHTRIGRPRPRPSIITTTGRLHKKETYSSSICPSTWSNRFRAMSTSKDGNDNKNNNNNNNGNRNGNLTKEELFSDERLSQIPISKTRTFSIIAHVDHGKSTIADKLLEIAGNVVLGENGDRQLLDDLKVEKERGITVKARTASMVYDGHLINLIDTPGHVDFSGEVERSLASCQGALLLVDSTQGIQAQTLANYNTAKDVGLKVIPILTKLDLKHSDPAMALEQIETAFKMDPDTVIWTSAKSGEGCDEILPEIIKRVPPPGVADPEQVEGATYRGRVVDSWYDKYKGTICLVNLDHGTISVGDTLWTSSVANTPGGKSFTVQELGLLLPEAQPRQSLRAGMVGYIVAGIKERAKANVGDFVCDKASLLHNDDKSYLNQKPRIFVSVFPVDQETCDELGKSLDRLTLNDSSVSIKNEVSVALGSGFRLGFLGRLHSEVFFQRLKDEFETEIIATAPAVPYWAVMKNGETIVAESPDKLPDKSDPNVDHFLEPMAFVTLLTPMEHMGSVLSLFQERRARQLDVEHLDEQRVILKYIMPWQEVIIDLHDQLKTVTSGFASFEYEEAPPERSKIVRVDLLINGRPVDPLAFVCHESVAQRRGRQVAAKLKSVVRRQQFEVVIQAAIGSKILCREVIKAFRKDVLVKSGKVVGGGDQSRKKKLLKQQKEGKQRLKTVGNVQLDQKAFLAVLER